MSLFETMPARTAEQDPEWTDFNAKSRMIQSNY